MPLAAQSPVTGAAVVRGSLDRQFARHIFTVSAWNPAKPLTLLLEYSPQGRWELDGGSGFFVFTEAGYANFRAGELPGSASVAAGDRLPGEGRRLQATIGAPVPGVLYVMVYNDSAVPMGYTLRATNGGISDSGGQAFDGGAPAPASGGDAPVFPFVVVPGPTPTPIPITPLPSLRASALRGLLDERYAQDFFTLEVVDTGLPLLVEMIYDPPEQILLIDSLNFWIFDEEQFRTQEISGSRPEFEPNRAAGTLTYREDVPVWTARIEKPLDRYMLVVNQHAYALSVGYRLTVENGVLVDEGQQTQAVATRPQPQPTSGTRVWDSPSIPSSQPLPRPTSRPTVGAPVANNLLDAAATQSSLQTMRDLLNQTPLAATLTGAGAYTLFAFTNDAFDALPPEQQDELLIGSPAGLAILSGHVVTGRITPEWVSRAKNVAAPGGKLLRLAPDGAGGFTVNGVPVVGPPQETSNGLLYRVEQVIE